MFPLYFPQVANEHMKYYYIIVSYVGGEQLRTSMKATSLPSSIVDWSTGEDNSYYNVTNVILPAKTGHVRTW